MIDEGRSDIVVHQECSEECVIAEPPIMLSRDDSQLIVLRQRMQDSPIAEIIINAETVPDLCRALRKLAKPDLCRALRKLAKLGDGQP